MNEYLQDRFSETSHTQFKKLLTQYLSQARNQVWLIGDGSFSDVPLTSGVLDWQPVFTTEPMNQYEEAGLFMARLQLDNQGLLRVVNQLERFSGSPMFSYIVTQRSQEEVAQLLTWLADAHTDDGLSLYLRIGDTRCLPYIFESLNRTQINYITHVVDLWRWFGRDAQWNVGKDARNARTRLPTDYTPPTTPNVIDAVQFDKLIEGGEVDLVYSAIDNIDALIPTQWKNQIVYDTLASLCQEAKQNQHQNINEIKNYIVGRLAKWKSKES